VALIESFVVCLGFYSKYFTPQSMALSVMRRAVQRLTYARGASASDVPRTELANNKQHSPARRKGHPPLARRTFMPQ
jgi:hypothetical protein